MSEQIPIPGERPVMSEQECRRIAEDLYARYQRELLENRSRPVDGNKWWYASGQGVIEDHLQQFPPEVLNHYWGHGVTKGSELDHLTAAISILANGAIRGSTAPLRSSGYVDAYTNGSFFVISRKGGQLIERGDDRMPLFVAVKGDESTPETRAIKINPGAVIVNAQFYPLVEELRRMFPGQNILYANQLPEYIRAEEESR